MSTREGAGEGAVALPRRPGARLRGGGAVEITKACGPPQLPNGCYERYISQSTLEPSAMPELVPVGTAPAAFEPAPITDAEVGAMFRACLNLFARWGVTDAEAAALLDTAPRTFARWKTGELGRLGRDQKARLSNLIGIHKALRVIFLDPERVYGWVRSRNRAFGMRSALEVMLGGELTDIMRVRRYLDAERGG